MMQNQIQTISEIAYRALMPDPTLNLYEWAKKEFYLPQGAAISGLIDFSFTPHLPQLLKWLSWSDPLRRLDIIKGNQLALTTISEIMIFGNIKMTPCNILMIFGNDTMAKEYVTERIEVPLKDNKHLQNLVRDKYDKDGNSNKNMKLYNGGATRFKGGETPRNYRNFPAKIGIIDDIDALGRDIGSTVKQKGEGSPVKLLWNRTNAQFGTYKLFISGTPKHEHNSNIWNEYKYTNKMLFMVPCINCGEKMYMEFFDIQFKYDNDYRLYDNLQPYIECKFCEERMTEKNKFKMFNQGVYQATSKQIDPFHNGIMIPSTYSLLGLTWRDLAVEFLEAKVKKKQGDESAMITFFNTKLAKAWKHKTGVTIEHTTLYKQREDSPLVPEQAIILSMGIDVQDNRFEITVIGYNQEGHRYFREHILIGGDTSIIYTAEGSPYLKLEQELDRTFENEFGIQQPIICSAIDMGYNSKVASPFVKYLQEKGVEIYPVFGKGGDHKVFVQSTTTLNKYNLDMYRVNVDLGKHLTYNQLKMEPDKRMLHFSQHASFTERFFQQLTIERPIIETLPNGQKKLKWYKPEHAKNEPFDTTNYSLASLDILEFDEEIPWNDYMEFNRRGHAFQDTDNTTFSVISEGF